MINEALDLMKLRLSKGTDKFSTKELMLAAKAENLEYALNNSSQYETVLKNEEDIRYKVLINEKTLKQTVDEKLISVPFKHNFKIGDIIYWESTNTYWIIYLQDTAEIAYFLGYMRKCKPYLIENTSVKKNVKVRAAVIGPDLADISSTKSRNLIIESPNLKISLLVPDTLENKEIFQRHSKFEMKDKTWEVQSVNDIDIEGILFISAKETYEMIEEIPKEEIEQVSGIVGKTSIKPLQTVTYSVGEIDGEWYFDKKLPISIINKTDNEITLKWTSMMSGSFDLSYGEEIISITVESLL